RTLRLHKALLCARERRLLLAKGGARGGKRISHHRVDGERLFPCGIECSAAGRERHQEDGQRLHAASSTRGLRGSFTRKWPPTASLTTLIRPPCASVNSRAIASPRPVPSTRALALTRPRKKESNMASRSSAGTPGPE